ncbi:sodium/proline symporter [Gayadomonas joobiniege]|uniref:sodium/proline symporter n=1 Tax=Gayadomonas joobiniege TaxID=1234606 RepID=UPI00035ECB4C|nr:sodium/proline symporter [Gayadomonas joobiniege]
MLDNVMLLSFIGFLACFALVGLSSAMFAKKDRDDYYLAGRNVSAWLTGLSAVATNNSGYMFIGVIGYTYATGLAAAWLMVGWIIGDLVASIYIHPKVQQKARERDAVSIMSLVSRWQGDSQVLLRRSLSWIALVLMIAYAGAQFIAGSKALHVLLDWPIWMGAILVSVLVAAYCFAGGIRASIWTDAAQSFVMIIAMSIMLYTAVDNQGGLGQVYDKLTAIPGYVDWAPEGMLFPGAAGVLSFAIGWMFAGFSVVGQPHVMVRFIALKNDQKMWVMRSWYYIWFTVFYCMATGVGMLSRLMLEGGDSFDAELALPLMAVELLPDWLVGLVLAGVFAATLSTSDSLILSASAAVSQDCFKKPINKTAIIKVITLLVTLFTLLVAIFAKQSVFSLVVFAWATLGCAVAPLLIGYIRHWKISQGRAIFVVVISVASAIVWRQLGWHSYIYEGLSGILIGTLSFYLLRLPSADVKVTAERK